METMEELLAIVADILKVGMRRIANVCPYLSKTGGMMGCGAHFLGR